MKTKRHLGGTETQTAKLAVGLIGAREKQEQFDRSLPMGCTASKRRKNGKAGGIMSHMVR